MGKTIWENTLHREYLYEKYINEDLSINQISDLTGADHATISKYLREFNISIDPNKHYLEVNGKYKKNYSGKLYKNWKITEFSHMNKYGNSCWKMICLGCNKEYIYAISRIKNGYSDKCLECTKRNNSRTTCIGELSGQRWATIKRNASNRNIAFEVTIEFAWDLYLKQEEKCAITKVPILLRSFWKDIHLNTASFDRIDSNDIYRDGNVQWVHKVVNVMKGKLSTQEFKSWCELVARNCP